MVMEDSIGAKVGAGGDLAQSTNRIWYLNDNNQFNDLEVDEYHDDVNDLEMDEYHDDVNDLKMDEYHDDVCRLQLTNKYIFCCVRNNEKKKHSEHPRFESTNIEFSYLKKVM